MAPTKEMSIETRERIIKFLEEGNSTRRVASHIGCSQSAVSKIWRKYKRDGDVRKGKHSGRTRKTSQRQDRTLRRICLENRNCTTRQMNSKWAATGVSVCDRTVRNRLKEMGFSYRKAKRKPALTSKQKRARVRWAKEKQSWTVDDWMKVIFSDETRICIGHGDDAETFVWCRANEVYKDECLKKTAKFPQSFLVWGCMSGKGPGEIAIITSTVNAEVYTQILDGFLIPSVEKMFGNDEFVFQDDNASCHRAKKVKDFLQERSISSMTWPANSPDLNPIENLWWKLKKLVHQKAPHCKADLLNAIRQSWNEVDTEQCLSLVKSMPHRIQAVIKAQGGATKY